MGKSLRNICNRCGNLRVTDGLPYCFRSNRIYRGEGKGDSCVDFLPDPHPAMEGMKICTKCGTVKTRSHFWKSDRSRDGLYPICKECKSLMDKIYYMTHTPEPDTNLYIIARIDENGDYVPVERPAIVGKSMATKILNGYKSNHIFRSYRILKIDLE